MMTYIALLRGINVSGRNIVKMETLRKVMGDAGFLNVSTYIQSGNILFKSGIPEAVMIEKEIVRLIGIHFLIDVAVIVLTPEDLQFAIDRNPFENENLPAPQPYVNFLSAIPDAARIAALDAVDFANDRYVFIGKLMFLHYADSPANTKLNNAIIENRLKIRATARNWKTVLKLNELAGKM